MAYVGSGSPLPTQVISILSPSLKAISISDCCVIKGGIVTEMFINSYGSILNNCESNTLQSHRIIDQIDTQKMYCSSTHIIEPCTLLTYLVS